MSRRRHFLQSDHPENLKNKLPGGGELVRSDMQPTSQLLLLRQLLSVAT